MRFILSITVLIFFISCKSGEPVDKLNYPLAKVVDVMVDLYIASEAIKDVGEMDKDSLLYVYKSQIEEIHQVNFDQIEEDIEIVRSNPSFYAEVHGIVNDSINSIEKEFQKVAYPNKQPKTNSSKKAKLNADSNPKSKPISFDKIQKIDDDQ
jgi:hypothetical protein